MRFEKKFKRVKIPSMWGGDPCLGGDWKGRGGKRSWLCVVELRHFFRIPKDVTEIYGVLSSNKLRDSYLLECDKINRVPFDRGTLSFILVDGKRVEVYRRLFDLIKRRFKGKCYGRIEY